MPAVALETFLSAAAMFPTGVELAWSEGSIVSAEASLREHGLLLLGECHGVAENPLIVEALIGALGIDTVAFEWPAGDERALLENPVASAGDGRVTAGHIALLRSVGCRVSGVDRAFGECRDESMAAAIARLRGRVLFVAGNVHTRLTPFRGAPTAGSLLAATRPALSTLDIHYRRGHFWNFGPRRFSEPEPAPPGPHLTVGVATEATVLREPVEGDEQRFKFNTAQLHNVGRHGDPSAPRWCFSTNPRM
jgi:hypothetical protein